MVNENHSCVTMPRVLGIHSGVTKAGHSPFMQKAGSQFMPTAPSPRRDPPARVRVGRTLQSHAAITASGRRAGALRNSEFNGSSKSLPPLNLLGHRLAAERQLSRWALFWPTVSRGSASALPLNAVPPGIPPKVLLPVPLTFPPPPRPLR